MPADRTSPTALDKAMEVLRVSRELTQVQDPSGVIETVLDGLVRMFGAERGFVVLEEADGRKVIASRNFDRGAVAGSDFTISHSVAKHVLVTGEATISTEVEGDEKMDPFATVHELRLKSVACLPLKMRGKTFGVIYLDTTRRRSPFSTEDRVFLEALAAQAAIGITNARLYRDAIRDGLTGLVSHRYFDLRLAEEVGRALRHGRPLSLLMFDVDNFKLINDLYGHETGNEILRTLSALLRTTLRTSDLPVRPGEGETSGELAGRYGGDEFEVLLPDTDRVGARIVGERLLYAVRALEFGEGGKIRTTISVGACTCPDDARDRQALMLRADEALYNAKRNGRNQFAFPDSPMGGTGDGRPSTKTPIDALGIPLSRDGMKTVLLISRLFEGGLELKRLLDLLLRQLAEAVNCERGLTLLVREEGKATPVAALGLTGEAYAEAGFAGVRALVEEAVAVGAPRTIVNAPDDARFSGPQGQPPAPVRSMAAIPIRTAERVLGAIYLDRAITRAPISAEDVNLALTLAGRLGRRLGEGQSGL
ncbi:MAG: diguanylate cyclase [Planctomycetes bacterium]|nr:diguanylate cyclase [Planctomycetota bacterium]